MSEENVKARNSEAKFASPDGSSTGIGYYFEGKQVSPKEFDRLVEEEADRIRAEEEAAARTKAEREEAEKGEG